MWNMSIQFENGFSTSRNKIELGKTGNEITKISNGDVTYFTTFMPSYSIIATIEKEQ